MKLLVEPIYSSNAGLAELKMHINSKFTKESRDKPDSFKEIERFETKELIEIAKGNLKWKVLLKAFETKNKFLTNLFKVWAINFEDQNITS